MTEEYFWQGAVMKPVAGGAAQNATLDAVVDADAENSDAPRDAPRDDSSESPSDGPNEPPPDVPGDGSSDDPNSRPSNAPSGAHKAEPSERTTFHLQMELAPAAAPRGPRYLRCLRRRLQGWQCDMRAWTAGFVVAALLFVVLVVAQSFALTDFSKMAPSPGDEESRLGVEHAPPTVPSRRPLGPT